MQVPRAGDAQARAMVGTVTMLVQSREVQAARRLL
jgi:hypothetical protein